MRNKRKIEIDELLMECIHKIWKDMNNKDVVCSSDLYQNKKYCGGYEGDLGDIENGEFAFGQYENGTEVCWLSIPYRDVQGIIEGKIDSVLAYDPE